MRFVDLPQFGAADVMRLADGPAPVAGPGEVLIRVAAAGVNRPDVVQRLGRYPAPAGHSPILGLEVAGHIAALGDGVTGFAIGQAVCALTNGGGYAEQVTVPAGQCLPAPAGLSLIQAAALPETLFTVWGNVFERARLQPGERLLVHGGSSGIGTTAIQLAVAHGAEVYATAGSAEKCRACEQLGARAAINYREQDFVTELKARVPEGLDVILDMVGGDYVARNLELAAVEGRIVNIAFLQGPKVDINLLPVMLKRLTLTGSTLRAQPNAAKASIASALHSKVWPWLESGKIRPVIHATYPLAQVAEAHKLMESSRHVGKIVLTVD
ncbi:NAD(P)H-quinone oxidoreductase [Simiduia agarivorans]|uniref:Zinc-containing alcohol dehydrogenase n=1 Tax=Simiduia agarivorans (strain DSM 21679 / JCM 13881 / BCRC 17597 / SA1) TaxID=1117647 RepID=K4L3K1_SIMAS|nr:NAD(P)H-quinone oxidoreductase [Simiduia agarivorans]AFV00768.1 zinc-containing alcohol dehydrogenase [Simiduia agarivorans SA1 = DSM 21679]